MCPDPRHKGAIEKEEVRTAKPVAAHR